MSLLKGVCPLLSKLNIVCHQDYIPEKYLPTFNSRCIELNFHRIEGLDEEYVYFNDDMFLTNHFKEKDFFKNGLPCDEAALRPMTGGYFHHTLLENMTLVNCHIEDKRKVILEKPSNWFNLKYGTSNIHNILLFLYKKFPGFKVRHIAQPARKSTLKELWDNNTEFFDNACNKKFRNYFTINPYIQRSWEIANNNIYPISIGKIGSYFSICGNSIENIIDNIENQAHSTICINDNDYDGERNFEVDKKNIVDAFQSILTNKSSFELIG